MAGYSLQNMTDDKSGFTVLELLIVIAMIGILATIANLALSNYREKAKVAICIVDMRLLGVDIASYKADHDTFPIDLAALNHPPLLDPWGHPYQYLNIADADLKGKGALRKYKGLVPINTDYDLSSMGPDGDTRPPLTAKASRDDIIRANDGAYFGPASDY